MIQCRKYKSDDNQFLEKMLYEAVFWSRDEEDRPSLEEGLSYNYTKFVLVDFGEREGDIAVVAEVDGVLAGAAFVRYWNNKEHIRGYMSEEIPVLVIGVDQAFRRQNVGSTLMEAIKMAVTDQGINKISLCVTKNNVAYKLYKNQGFKITEDIDDSYNMIWKV